MAQVIVSVVNTNDDGSKFGGSSFTTSNFQIGRTILNLSATGALRFQNVTVPQGSIITSAKITWTPSGTYGSNTIHMKISGIAEDNTANFTSDPTGRAKTGSNVTYDPNPSTNNVAKDTSDLTAIVQEIVNRGGWSSGNSMGFLIEDNGSDTDTTMNWYDYSNDSSKVAILTINYAGFSPSASLSPSASQSPSPSPSVSPSASISPSASPSPSPLPAKNPAVLKIAKPGVNVLTNSDPEKFIYSSEYGTLKYFSKQNVNIFFNSSGGDISAKGVYAHNLGYYPYCEVFVRVYTGSTPSGNYEYCPFFGSGASVLYAANVKIDKTNISVYGEILGVSSDVWHFDFLIFIFANDLDL